MLRLAVGFRWLIVIMMCPCAKRISLVTAHWTATGHAACCLSYSLSYRACPTVPVLQASPFSACPSVPRLSPMRSCSCSALAGCVPLDESALCNENVDRFRD